MTILIGSILAYIVVTCGASFFLCGLCKHIHDKEHELTGSHRMRA